jgi:hypothetical protein
MCVQADIKARSLAHGFEEHWDACISDIEDKAVQIKRYSCESLQHTLALLGSTVAHMRPTRIVPPPVLHSQVPGRALPYREAHQPRTPHQYTGSELRKGSVAAYAGPPPPPRVCRRWWYDGACSRGDGCYFAASHTAENASKGDAV